MKCDCRSTFCGMVLGCNRMIDRMIVAVHEVNMPEDDVELPASIIAKEVWENPRVSSAAVKDVTAYYGGNDDFVPNPS